tara:strand:- start:1813 stop:2493 length:681 start_codon:yes stop_codon:yes gene_type:complete
MSDFNEFDEIVKNKKQNDISDDDQSIDDTEEGEKIGEDDASTDGEEITGFESDIEEDEPDEDIEEGFFDEETGEQTFTSNIDDNASVSSFGSEISDESNNDDYFQKFNTQVRQDIISEYHPESSQVNYQEVNTLSEIVRNNEGKIIDPFHNTIPILSKFEKTRVLGLRSKQINEGAKPFVEINQDNYDGYIIASKELVEKKIPFIIRRPLPNGASEYWRLSDLEVI